MVTVVVYALFVHACAHFTIPLYHLFYFPFIVHPFRCVSHHQPKSHRPELPPWRAVRAASHPLHDRAASHPLHEDSPSTPPSGAAFELPLISAQSDRQVAFEDSSDSAFVSAGRGWTDHGEVGTRVCGDACGRGLHIVKWKLPDWPIHEASLCKDTNTPMRG